MRELQQTAKPERTRKVFWFSGPQPIQISGTERLKQIYERRDPRTEIVACLSGREYNALYELAPLSFSEVRYLYPDGSLANRTIRFRKIGNEANPKAKGSAHPYRIRLAEQTRKEAADAYFRQASTGRDTFQRTLRSLAERAAADYLVTQLSGAVVLETDAQYKENDLEPGDPDQVPVIPEFRHCALALGLLSLAAVAAARRRRMR
ncbi:MAG: hypothetical protein ACOC4K_00105 [Verrucomicrobiota bacterium]